MLLNGVLVQLGQTMVMQQTAKTGMEIAPVKAARARVSVFRDQWPGSWEEFSHHPVKFALQKLPALLTCRIDSCDCEKWHATSEEGTQDCILDVFRRQFFADTGRPVPWDKATHFSVMTIRYVKTQEFAVLSASGSNGIYVEPKNEAATAASDEYQVVWVGTDFADASHKAQCEAHSCGLARHGNRFGIRVSANHFQATFQNLKPDGLFLGPGPRITWTCGPWPYGSDRRSLSKIFKQMKWDARPSQPTQSVPGGQMWSVQSAQAPDTSVWNLKHGQVVVTKTMQPAAANREELPIIGQTSTVELRQMKGEPQDPLMLNDPWKRALSTVPAAAAPASKPDLAALEHRIQQNILAKLPQETMEVDDQLDRIAQLEAQFQQLSTRQASLETTVSNNHAQSTAQVQSLQAQMAAQMEHQGKQIQSMFDCQMAKLENILSRDTRARHE